MIQVNSIGQKTDALLKEMTLFSDNGCAIIMRETEIQDIYTLEDTKFAELNII